jgi:hypothetical protein
VTVPVLDLRTIDRLAELICDMGGPHQRSVRQIQRFLDGAGWKEPYPGYGGRVPWLAATITRRNDDLDAVLALVRRVVDPREYGGDTAAARSFIDPVNALLAPDGLVVGLDGSRPYARTASTGVDGTERIAAALSSPELRARIRGLVSDEALADVLVARLDEIDAARTHGAYVLAIVGTGSLVEGLLDDVMKQRDPETRKLKETNLGTLLDRAHKRGWIQPDVLDFSHVVREYRNFVHPREQHKRKITPDEDTVLMCWQPVLALINDLHERLPGRRSAAGH